MNEGVLCERGRSFMAQGCPWALFFLIGGKHYE